MTVPKPPRSLGPTGRLLWRDLHREFVFRDAGSREQVLRFCEAGDMAAEAKKVLDRDGSLSTDRYGKPVRHPAVQLYRDAVLLQAQLAKLLGLFEAQSGTGRKLGT
jgi:phage terminase small subunit